MDKDKTPTSANLRVAGRSDPSAVAGSVCQNLIEGNPVSLTAIGAGAVNQMLKAVTIARSIAASSGYDLCFPSGFATEILGGAENTSLKILYHNRI